MNYQQFDQWLIEQAKNLPVPRNDRSAQATAQNAANTAATTAAGYGTNASGIAAPLTKFATGQMTAPPGYGTADLNSMIGAATAAGSEATGVGQEQAALQAGRTHNLASLSANQDAIAQAASRGVGANVQDILAQNANVKLQQQQQGGNLLQGLYGTDVGAQQSAAGQVPGDLNAKMNAGQGGWLQNTTGILGTLGSLGGGAGSILQGLNGKGR